MTISTTASRVDYVGNGVTTSFPVPFVFFGPDELVVVRRVIASGAETILVRGTDYSVSGGNGSPGTVVAAAAPPSAVQWTIRRVTRATQETDYVEGDPFPAVSHERALDRLTALVQELQETDLRTVRVPVTDPGTNLILPARPARASRLLAFDANGDPIAADGAVGAFPVTSFAATLLDDTSEAQARTTLGLFPGYTQSARVDFTPEPNAIYTLVFNITPPASGALFIDSILFSSSPQPLGIRHEVLINGGPDPANSENTLDVSCVRRVELVTRGVPVIVTTRLDSFDSTAYVNLTNRLSVILVSLY